MLNRSKELPDEPAPKRPRLSEPVEQSKTFQRPLNRQTLPPLVGPSTIDLPRPSTSRRAEARDRQRAHDTDDSDDPINSFPKDSQHHRGGGSTNTYHPSQGRSGQEDVYLDNGINHHSPFNNKSPARRQGTPSGTTAFESIGPKRDKFEKELPDPKPLPHLTMGTIKGPKVKRILNMKGQASLLSWSTPCQSFIDALCRISRMERTVQLPKLGSYDNMAVPSSTLQELMTPSPNRRCPQSAVRKSKGKRAQIRKTDPLLNPSRGCTSSGTLTRIWTMHTSSLMRKDPA